jgi:hypothetical protein
MDKNEDEEEDYSRYEPKTAVCDLKTRVTRREEKSIDFNFTKRL